MALERVPADIRRQGGVARMTDPKVYIGQKIMYKITDVWFFSLTRHLSSRNITEQNTCLVL